MTAMIIRFFRVGIDPNIRDSFNRDDPDSTFNGFFPHWGVVILILSGKGFLLATLFRHYLI